MYLVDEEHELWVGCGLFQNALHHSYGIGQGLDGGEVEAVKLEPGQVGGHVALEQTEGEFFGDGRFSGTGFAH